MVNEMEVMYGSNAKVVQVEDGMIVVVEDGYCHGGILLNNNAQNKCLMHRYPALEPLSHLPHLLNIMTTTLSDLLAHLHSPSPSSSVPPFPIQIITACHPTIKLSKLSNGGDSHFAIINNKVVLATRYVPLSKQDLIGVLFCGGSNYEMEGQGEKGYVVSSVSLGRRESGEEEKEREMASVGKMIV